MSDGDDEVYHCCADVGPQGYACTRRKNHDDDHMAKSIGVEWGDGNGDG